MVATAHRHPGHPAATGSSFLENSPTGRCHDLSLCVRSRDNAFPLIHKHENSRQCQAGLMLKPKPEAALTLKGLSLCWRPD